MEDFLSNKDSSNPPWGTLWIFRYKICRHRLYTGCKGCRIIGVSGFRHKRRTRPFSVYEECAQLVINKRAACTQACILFCQSFQTRKKAMRGHFKRAASVQARGNLHSKACDWLMYHVWSVSNLHFNLRKLQHAAASHKLFCALVASTFAIFFFSCIRGYKIMTLWSIYDWKYEFEFRIHFKEIIIVMRIQPLKIPKCV